MLQKRTVFAHNQLRYLQFYTSQIGFQTACLCQVSNIGLDYFKMQQAWETHRNPMSMLHAKVAHPNGAVARGYFQIKHALRCFRYWVKPWWIYPQKKHGKTRGPSELVDIYIYIYNTSIYPSFRSTASLGQQTTPRKNIPEAHRGHVLSTAARAVYKKLYIYIYT